MMVRIKGDIASLGYEKEVSDYLLRGKMIRAYIHEYETNDPKTGWYLLEINKVYDGVYMTDGEVGSGSLVRTFRDPDLPANYSKGPYIWMDQRHCEPFHENNKSAKSLLKQYEWRL